MEFRLNIVIFYAIPFYIAYSDQITNKEMPMENCQIINYCEIPHFVCTSSSSG